MGHGFTLGESLFRWKRHDRACLFRLDLEKVTSRNLLETITFSVQLHLLKDACGAVH